MLVERGELGARPAGPRRAWWRRRSEIDRPGPLLASAVASRRALPGAGWRRLQAESGIDVEYRDRRHPLRGARRRADGAALSARARWQRRPGLRVTGRSHRRAARRLSVPARPAGADPRCAAHFPDDHRVNNERLAVAAGLAASRAGVTVRERAPRACRRSARGRVAGVRTAAGSIARAGGGERRGGMGRRRGRPPGVVVAAGASRARPDAGAARAPGTMRCRCRSTRRARLSGPADRRAHPARQHARARRLREAGDRWAPRPDCSAAAMAMAPGLARRDARRRLCRPASRHAGRAARPGRGARPARRLYYATGLYRSGILLAPAVATAVTELIVDGRTALSLAAFRPGRRMRARGAALAARRGRR